MTAHNASHPMAIRNDEPRGGGETAPERNER